MQGFSNPEWSKNEKFIDQFSRWQNQDELNKLIAVGQRILLIMK